MEIWREISGTQRLAVKRFNMGDEDSAETETAAYQGLNHENIVGFKGADTDEDGKRVIILEYVLQTLASVVDHAKDRPSFRTTIWFGRAKKMIRQITMGMSYLHRNNIIHGDLKPGNILLDDDDTVKICDLGHSQKILADSELESPKNIGSLWYKAPELLRGCHQYGPGIDVWSISHCHGNADG